MHDIRFALRSIAARPWFASAIIVTLALGIGINTTVFTLVNAVLFKPLPFPTGERLRNVVNVRSSSPGDRMNLSYLELLDYRAQTSSFETLESAVVVEAVITEAGAPPERIRTARITGGLLGMTGMLPALGRSIQPSDDQPGAPQVVVLSHDVWRNRYGAAADVLGRPVRIDDTPATIVGVMPPGFQFPNREQMWTQFVPNDDERSKRDHRVALVVGLLKPGVTSAQAGTEIGTVAARLASTHPATNEGVEARLLTFNERFNAGEIRTMFLLMLGAVGFVLLVTCANVANMMLSRAIGRRREMAVRTALGASRWRIVRQLLVESVVLSLAGGLAGLGLAAAGVRAFDMAVRNVGKPSWITFEVDYAALGYCAAVCVMSGLLFGLAPALRSARVELNRTLKDGGRSGSGHGGRLSATLVVVQFALAVVLLAGAGLLVRSFQVSRQITHWVPGSAIMTARVSLPAERYGDAASRARFFDEALASLTRVGGVTGAALSSHPPGNGNENVRIEIEGRLVAEPGERDTTWRITASSGYFTTIGMPLVRGRDFDERDGQEGLEAAIVTREFATRYWPGQDAVGRRFRFNPEQTPGPWTTVVGVTGPMAHGDNGVATDPAVFVPLRQTDPRSMLLLARTDGDAAPIAGRMRSAVQRLDAELPLSDVVTLDELLARSRWPYLVFGTAFSIFAVTSLVMAAVGLYGVMSQATQRRTREIGIRVALGATPARVVRTVVSRGLVQLVIGIAIGLALASASTGTMRTLLFGVTPHDPLVLGVATLSLAVVGLLACCLPARRAALLAPMHALNSDDR